MKTKIISNFCLLTSALFLCASVANMFAQDAATNFPPIGSVTSTNLVKDPSVLQQLIGAGPTLYVQVKTLSFRDGFKVIPFGIRHGSDYGGGLALTTANTNGVNAGFALAAIHEHTKDPATGKARSSWEFYDATINISLNGTTTIPFINWPVDYFLQSGPAVNLKDLKTVYEQSEAGIQKTFKLGKHFGLDIGGGEGHCSRWSNGFYQEAHIACIAIPKGW